MRQDLASMRRPITYQDVVTIFAAFGIDMPARWRLCETPQEQVEAFEAAKAEVKILYRKLALEDHPDRGGSGEKLKVASQAWDTLQKCEMKPRPPQQPKSAFNLGMAQIMAQGLYGSMRVVVINPFTGQAFGAQTNPFGGTGTTGSVRTGTTTEAGTGSASWVGSDESSDW